MEEIAMIRVNETPSWGVKIRKYDGRYIVSGRGTQMQLHVKHVADGLLVSIPCEKRCGIVPEDCSGRHIMDYCGIKNKVDATTLAAAVRYLVSEGMIDLSQ